MHYFVRKFWPLPLKWFLFILAWTHEYFHALDYTLILCYFFCCSNCSSFAIGSSFTLAAVSLLCPFNILSSSFSSFFFLHFLTFQALCKELYCISPFNTSITWDRFLIASPFYRWRNWSTEMATCYVCVSFRHVTERVCVRGEMPGARRCFSSWLLLFLKPVLGFHEKSMCFYDTLSFKEACVSGILYMPLDLYLTPA